MLITTKNLCLVGKIIMPTEVLCDTLPMYSGALDEIGIRLVKTPGSWG